LTRRLVFVDTWAWVAALVRDDRDHRRVQALNAKLVTEGARSITSNFVLAESFTRIRRDGSLHAALGLADSIEELTAAGAIEVVIVDEPLWQAGMAWFRRYDDQDFSFVDCTSFAIMAARGIAEALTADRHFATAGFVPLGVA